MEVFRPWTVQFFEIFYFLFFVQVWNIMCYDAPLTPMRQLNRKWAWSVKMEVFRPWTVQFFEKFFFFHIGMKHHAL